MTRRPSSRSDPDLSASQRNEELGRLALDIIAQEIRRSARSRAPGALAAIRQPTFKTKVQKAVAHVQNMKTTKKSEWDYRIRYPVLTAQQRKVAANIAAALSRLRVAIKPLETGPGTLLDWKLSLDIEDSDPVHFPMDRAEVEKWLKHFREVAATKVRRGSPLDVRKLVAVQTAARLFRAAGLSLNQTRNGAADQLSAILWGDPETPFEHYVEEFIKSERARARRQTRTE
jgi:hypothetical protein